MASVYERIVFLFVFIIIANVDPTWNSRLLNIQALKLQQRTLERLYWYAHCYLLSQNRKFLLFWMVCFIKVQTQGGSNVKQSVGISN